MGASVPLAGKRGASVATEISLGSFSPRSETFREPAILPIGHTTRRSSVETPAWPTVIV